MIRSLLPLLLLASLLLQASAEPSLQVLSPQSGVEAREPVQPVQDERLREVLRLTNEQRRRHGLSTLQIHPGLQKAAMSHAVEMRELNYFSHTSPNPSRRTTRKRVQLFGCNPIMVAENIVECSGYDDQGAIRFAADSFFESPPHRRNLLNPDITHVGIGFVRKDGWVSISQVFGAGF